MKKPEKRSKEEIKHLVAHLKFRVPFFKDYQEALLSRVAETLEY
jgi:hypothetical protein